MNLLNWFKDNEEDIILIIGIILISLISFGGGWLMGNSSDLNKKESKVKIKEIPVEELKKQTSEEKNINTNKQEKTIETSRKIQILKPQEEVQVDKNADEPETSNGDIAGEEISPEENDQIVGNLSSKIFHLASCTGAKTMNDENKIYFNSKEEAEEEGYRAAKNCPGLQD